MPKLRLLLFEDCNRRCRGCCNKDWNLRDLPVCTDFAGYEMIMLTGGEPMLRPDIIKSTVEKIREQTTAPIYVYTAKTDNLPGLRSVLKLVDGLTVTLHSQKDVKPFLAFDALLSKQAAKGKSLRLNIFRGVNIRFNFRHYWQSKYAIEWIKDAPLPTDEQFMRLTRQI